jgi:uncharacterized membrane protein YebE (DUF533 family)
MRYRSRRAGWLRYPLRREGFVNDLDVEGLVGSVLRGVLGSRGKRSHGTLRYLTGGRSSFLNASTLLAVAGVAWGLWETAQAQSAAPAAGTPGAVPPPPPGGLTVPPPLPPSAWPGSVVPPPIPGAAAVAQSYAAPANTALPNAALADASLPNAAPATAAAVQPDAAPVQPDAAPVQADVLRVLRLTLAAARADGTLESTERDAILARAKQVGAEPLIAAEIDHPQELAAIVGDVEDLAMRGDLYTLAYAIVRADEQVSGAERSWLTELAAHLRVDPATASALEQQAAARIAAAAQGAEH